MSLFFLSSHFVQFALCLLGSLGHVLCDVMQTCLVKVSRRYAYFLGGGHFFVGMMAAVIMMFAIVMLVVSLLVVFMMIALMISPS